MIRQRADYRLLSLAFVLCTVGLLLPFVTENRHLSPLFYILATSLVSFDVIDLGLRLVLTHIADARTTRAERPSGLKKQVLEPFAIVMSVHNLLGDADRLLAPFEQYKSRTWIIDDYSSDETVRYLRAHGWHCLDSDRNRRKPGALNRLLANLPADIRTVFVFDPDSAPLDSGRFELPDLEYTVRRFQQSGAAACCPRIRYREGNPLVAFQALECEFAFSLGRKGLPPHSITSGVSMYDRNALESALQRHSLSVYAEDLENSVILLDGDRQIHYEDDLIIETDGKTTWDGWFSQRVGWSFGLARVLVSRRREVSQIARKGPWCLYNFVFYLGFLTFLFLPIKAVGVLVLTASFANSIDQALALGLIADNAFTDPRYFVVSYIVYTGLVAALALYTKPAMRPLALLTAVPFYLFYAVAHTIAIATGYINWLSVRFIGRRVYRDHYTSDTARVSTA